MLLVEAVYFDSAHRPIEYIMSRYRNELPYAIRIRRNSGSSSRMPPAEGLHRTD